MIVKPSLLVEAVKTIDEISEEIDKDSREKGQAFQDIQGDVYEYLLSEIAQAGKNGQFRTPRHIIKLMAELVAPKLGHRIGDPACGTSGFLLGAYQYIVAGVGFLFHNLAPACHECNSSYKQSKDPLYVPNDPLQNQNGGRRKSFYPFETGPYQIELKITLNSPDWTNNIESSRSLLRLLYIEPEISKYIYHFPLPINRHLP